MQGFKTSHKLIFGFLAAAIIPVIVVILANLLLLRIEEKAILDLYLNQSRDVIDSAEIKLEAFFKKINRSIRLLQSDPELVSQFEQIKSLSGSNIGSPEYQKSKNELNAVLQTLQRSEGLSDIFLTGKDGIIYYASNSAHFWEYLGKSLEKIMGLNLPSSSSIYTSEIFKDPIKGNYQVLVAAPLLNGEEEVEGMMFIELPMATVYQFFLESHGPGQSTEIILAKKSKEDTLLAASPLDYDYNAILNKTILHGKASKIMREHLDDFGYGKAINYKDNEVLYFWKKISDLDQYLFVTTNINEMFSNIKNLEKFIYFTTLTFGVLFTLFAIFLAKIITKPLLKLVNSVKKTTPGQLSAKIDPELLEYKDEIGALAYAFKDKNEQLDKYFMELKDAEQQLVISEKMAALGNLVAGIAHEVNTPLGAINASISNITTSLQYVAKNLPKVLMEFSTKEKMNDFFQLLDRSSESRSSLPSREERLALEKSLKTMGVKHYENAAEMLTDMGIKENVEPFLPLIQKDLDLLQFAYHFSSMEKNGSTMSDGIKQASRIIYALKSYAHFEVEGKKSQENIKEGIETVLTLYQNKFKFGINVVRNYFETPLIYCHPDELNQVWTNLIQNAVDAMDNKGTLTIDLFQKGDFVVVSFTDTGSGILEKIKHRIFDPFFTTKPSGQGSGIGLSVVKKIVDKHGGKIIVDSTPGKTTFSIYLPV